MARPRLDAPNFRLVLRGDRFYVRWWDGAAWQRVSTRSADRREATRFLAQFAAGFSTPDPPALPTISQILDGYLADRKDRVSAFGTLQACSAALKRHLGDLQPDHLTKERSRFYVRCRRAEGYEVGPAKARRRKPVGDGTVIRELVTLRAAIRWAIGEKWITYEPYIETPSQPPPRDRWFSRQEAEALLGATIMPHVKVFMALALYTAGRAGAILDLKWSEVDLKTKMLDLGQGRGNKRRARVPINEMLAGILTEARQAATCPYVVERASKRVGSVKTGIRAAARRAGVTGATPHVFRHTAAAWMLQSGRPIEEVAKYLGNKVEMVERVYGHHSPEWLRAASDSLMGPLAPKTQARTANTSRIRKDRAR